MDRTSKRKIKHLWLLLLLGVLFLGMLTYLFLGKNSDISDKQIEEMTILHPELKEEIHSTFSYYESKRRTLIIGMGGISIVLFAITFIGSCFYHKKMMQELQKSEADNKQTLLKQLEQFQKGNYAVRADLFRPRKSQELSDKWSQLEEQLRKLGYCFLLYKEQLEKEENSTKSLITDISHQLKTPLASLKMSYELSQESGLSTAEKKEFIQKEKQEILKLESLLDELVKLSRLESHMIEVQKKMTGVRKLITEAMNQVVLKAYEKKITLQTDISEDITVKADEKWTVEAFVNVLDNAIKYSATETIIELRVSRLPNLVLIEIEDEGIGIPANELHKVFQRFYRGREASSYAKEGAGVGLYLSRKILEEQGGTITAKRKQTGTIFRITLPL